MGKNMSRCYTFDEWFNICGKLEDLYWTCIKACEKYAEEFKEDKEKFRRIVVEECPNKCEEKVAKYGMERYGLTEKQALLCMHLSGPA